MRHAWRWLVQRPKYLSVGIYFLVALPLTVSSAWVVPPNQIPDEMAHWFRASQLNTAHWYGERPSTSSAGGQVDAGVADFAAEFFAGGLGTEQELLRASQHRFSGSSHYMHFPNTIRYAPALYLPAALGIAAGQWLDLSVASTFRWARTCNAVAAVALITAALWICRRGQLLLTALGLMPMALFLMGSVSQDACLLACSILLAAQMTRLERPSQRAFIRTAILILVLACARFPMIGLLPLLLLRAWRPLISYRTQVLAAFSVTVLFVGWVVATFPLQAIMRGDVPASIQPQLTYLWHHPSALWPICRNTFANEWTGWRETFIGKLGWLTVPLSREAYQLGTIALTAACLITLTEAKCIGWRDRGILLLGVSGVFAMILLASYLTWTPVGANHIQGAEQGRYFYGLVPLLAAILPGWSFLTKPWWRITATLVTVCCLALLLREAVHTVDSTWSHLCAQAMLQTGSLEPTACLQDTR